MITEKKEGPVMPQKYNSLNTDYNERFRDLLEVTKKGVELILLHGIEEGACTCYKKESCPHPGKHPVEKDWIHKGTTNLANILKRLEKENPFYNIGIVTGEKSGVIAIDVDPRNGGNESLEEIIKNYGEIPETVETITGGGGRHILLKHPNYRVHNKPIAPGLDIKADGGFIVAPGSLHISGNYYEFELSSFFDSVELAPMPNWIPEAQHRYKNKSNPEKPKTNKEAKILEGGRNNYLTSIAGTMRRKGIDQKAIELVLQIENKNKCVPPLPEPEVAKIAKSISRYEPEPLEEPLKAEEEKPVIKTISDYLESTYWEELERNRQQTDIKTGIASLDKHLGGGLYEGLYVLGAIPALGKTALTLQIADYIAEQGKKVLFFSLEMSAYEMISRSLTRSLVLNYKEEDASILEINTGKVIKGEVSRNIITPVLTLYNSQIGGNMAIEEGNFDITVHTMRKKIQQYIEITGETPVVFVDYLQVIRPIDARMGDKQAVDFNIIELKRISRDLKTPVIVVSSFNRGNYKAKATFEAFKESGGIEYTADVVLGMQLDISDKMTEEEIEEIKNRDERPVELIILKNRRGKSFVNIPLQFYPKWNYFLDKYGHWEDMVK